MCNPPFFNKEECEERFQHSDDSDFKNLPGFIGLPKSGPQSGTVAKHTELWVQVCYFTRKYNVFILILGR